jgi:N-acyl-D-amino-acid deacylase
MLSTRRIEICEDGGAGLRTLPRTILGVMTYDILIRGGHVFDGSGSAGIAGDVAIDAGRIVALGPDVARNARRTINASGLAVAPGFIDIKTHSDFTLPINPKAESKVRQGVTTEIIGHCGFSVAPVLPGKVELLRDYLSASAPWLPFREMTFADYSRPFRRPRSMPACWSATTRCA